MTDLESWQAIVAALGDTIRDLGRVPAGELYAVSMASLTLDAFTRAIDTLKRRRLVQEVHHVLIWVGPQC